MNSNNVFADRVIEPALLGFDAGAIFGGGVVNRETVEFPINETDRKQLLVYMFAVTLSPTFEVEVEGRISPSAHWHSLGSISMASLAAQILEIPALPYVRYRVPNLGTKTGIVISFLRA